MGSPCALSFYCCSQQQFEFLVEQCIAKVSQLEDRYSRFKPDSLVSQINNSAGRGECFELDSEFRALLLYADTAYTISDGLFDITSGVLRKVWDFKSHKIPALGDIAQTLNLVGWPKVSSHLNTFSLPIKGMEIDLGGIVKEYAADLLVSLTKKNGLQHGLVDLGGDIAIVGAHPDNSPWQVAISHPQKPSHAIATIPLMSGALASSGDYQRFIVINKERYSHILDPMTGWPVKGFAAVSVWAPQCVVAGTLATTAMLKGEIKGGIWLNEVACHYLTVNQDMFTNINQ
jgi:thiamine biosynthesis lipoprotein